MVEQVKHMVEWLKKESVYFHDVWKAQHALIMFNAELNQCKSRLSLNGDLVMENDLVRRIDMNSIPWLMEREKEFHQTYSTKLE